jgi:bifunctional non-homologous end joining protein LigD
MKAVAGDLPAGDGWAYEIKWDGMRIVSYVEGSSLRLETTRGLDAIDRFPELAGLSDSLGVDAILDGEIVAFEQGRPNFGTLQHRMHVVDPQTAERLAVGNPIVYLIFDLLHLDGHDTTALPYLDRRRLLSKLVDDADDWRVPPHHLDDGAGLLAAARDQHLEGIVAKRVDSHYLPGKRSPSWVKVKVRNRQEFVIGGWQPGEGRRSGSVGSLLLGVHDSSGEPERTPGPELRYAGKVGTGFSDAELVRLAGLLAELRVAEPPFTPPPPDLVARTARWVRPELVAEVLFGEWTSEAILRHASYLGLRNDKDPSEVVRET